jgi:hypothetical protein
MTRRDVASDIPNSNEEFESLHGESPRTPRARGPAVVESKMDLQLNCNDEVWRASEFTCSQTN